jgi:hypothetical protein
MLPMYPAPPVTNIMTVFLLVPGGL